MGMFATGGPELAEQVVTGSLAATGAGNAAGMLGMFNIALWGTFVGTVVLQKSFDAGTTWIPVFSTYTVTAISFTAPVAMVFMSEPEDGVLYRFNCTAYTSGTINYRISTSIPRTSNTSW